MGFRPASSQLRSPRNPLSPLPGALRHGVDYYSYLTPRIVRPNGSSLRGPEFADSVYEYDANQHLRKIYPTSSSFYSPNQELPAGKAEDFDYLFRYLTTQPRFSHLLHDPWRRLYYRVLHHAIPYDNAADGTHADPRAQSWSLLIFDENWRKRGEVVFPGGRYAGWLFVTRQGLLIARQSANAVEDGSPLQEWELFLVTPGTKPPFADVPTEPVPQRLLLPQALGWSSAVRQLLR